MDRRRRSTLWLFSGLTVYILAQFVWWAVLLLRRNEELNILRARLASAGDPALVTPARSGNLMVLGEASVFLLLLLVVVWLTYRSVRNDLRLASAQRNFLLAVTHELRTPIAAVKLQLQTLDRPGISDAQRNALIATASQETDRLALLTEKVLLAASGEEGIGARPELIDLCPLARSVAEQASRTYAADHRILLELPHRMDVMADPQILRSVLENLLENAAKYSPKGSEITLRAQQDEGAWQVSVLDHGPGVPLPERERIFERFYRSGSEETREQPGTGLGLYIVKRLVERCGGRIGVSDRQPHGAIFTASFPHV